ncbi:MAG: hypothetical protein ACYC1D_00565 [Acidimicrobiales bacterium]
MLADRDRFDLDATALEEWKAINARTVSGLRWLMQRSFSVH